MSSNLLKSYLVSPDAEGARVINSNELIAKKLERIRMVLPDVNLDSFQAVDLAQNSENEEFLDALTSDDGFESGVIKAQPQETVYTGPTKEELEAEAAAARAEIEAMRVQAMNDLAAEQQRVLENARMEGYEAGRKQGMQECDALRVQLEQERASLQAVYEEQIDRLEPEFIRTLTGIYEKIFEVGLDNQQEIIVSLLRNTMKKLDGCKNFLIHVSTADYGYVKEHKSRLYSDSTQEGTVIDIVEDAMIREHECTIETMNGIYDCGIGTQLGELRKKLMLLSYDGRQES